MSAARSRMIAWRNVLNSRDRADGGTLAESAERCLLPLRIQGGKPAEVLTHRRARACLECARDQQILLKRCMYGPFRQDQTRN